MTDQEKYLAVKLGRDCDVTVRDQPEGIVISCSHGHRAPPIHKQMLTTKHVLVEKAIAELNALHG